MEYLIIYYKQISKLQKALDFFLALDTLPDAVFYDIYEKVGSGFSTLHYAATFAEYGYGEMMAAWVLQKIFEKFEWIALFEFSNSRWHIRGSDPLHIAAATANVQVVQYLPDEELDGLDLTLLDRKGRTALDSA